MIFRNTPIADITEIASIGANGRVLIYDKDNNRLVTVDAQGIGQFVDLTDINTQISGLQSSLSSLSGRVEGLEGYDLDQVILDISNMLETQGNLSASVSTLSTTTIPNLQASINGQIGAINNLLGSADIGEGVTLTGKIAEFNLTIDGFDTKFTTIEADLDPNNEGGLVHTLNAQYSSFVQTAEGIDQRVGSIEAEFVDGGRVHSAEALLSTNSDSISALVSRVEYTNVAVGTIDVVNGETITDNDGNFIALGVRKGMALYFTTGNAINEMRVIQSVTSNSVTLVAGDPGQFTVPAVGDTYAIGDAGRLASALFKVQADQISSRVTSTEFTNWQNTTYSQDITDLNNAIQASNDGTLITYFQANEPASGNEGDLWFDTDDNNKLYRYDSSGTPANGWVAVADSRIATLINDVATAQSTADGKIQTFFSETAPTDDPVGTLGVGDLWFNTAVDGNNVVSYWDGTQWVVLDDPRFTQLNNDMSDVQSALGTKITSYYSETPPTAPTGGFTEGDLWFDLNLAEGTQTIYRWDPNEGASGGWVDGTDSRVAQAISQATLALASADGKAQTFFQDNPPANDATNDLQPGDLWFDTNDGFKQYYWSGTAWTDGSDGRIATALDRLDDAEALIDGKIDFYYQTSAPVEVPAGNPPIVFKEGDRWVNTADGKEYRWNNTTNQWVQIENSDFAQAVQDASDALALADHKVTLYVGTSAPTGTVELPLKIGDMWIDTSIVNPGDPVNDQFSLNLLYVWDGTEWVARRDGKVIQNESNIIQNSDSITQIVERLEYTTITSSVVDSYNDTSKALTDTAVDFLALGIEIGHLVEFTDGNAKGQIRTVLSVDTNVLTLQDTGGADPSAGDNYRVGNLSVIASTVIKQTADEIALVAGIANDAQTRVGVTENQITLQAEQFGLTTPVTGVISAYNDTNGRVTDAGHGFVAKKVSAGMLIRFTSGQANGTVRVISAVTEDYVDTVDEGGLNPQVGDSYEIATPGMIASSLFKIQADEISSVVTDLDQNYSTTSQTTTQIDSVVAHIENVTEISGVLTSYNSATWYVNHTGRNFISLGVKKGMMIHFTSGNAQGTARAIINVGNGAVATKKVPGQPDPAGGDSYVIAMPGVITSSVFKQTADAIELKVGNDEIFSKMTQLAEGFIFEANQIKSSNFNGVITDGVLQSYGSLGWAFDKMGNFGAKSGLIGGLEIVNNTLRKSGDNQSLLEIIASNRPAVHLVADNGEELWIGGDFSFDGSGSVSYANTVFNPDLTSQATSALVGNNTTYQAVSDEFPLTECELVPNQSQTAGKTVRMSLPYDIMVLPLRQMDDVANQWIYGDANALVYVELEVQDFPGNTLYTDTVTKELTVGGNIGVIGEFRETGTVDFTFEMPATVYRLFVRYRVLSSVATHPYNQFGQIRYVGAEAEASITIPATVITALAVREFISPLGASWYNNANDKRVSIDRDEGRVTQSSMVIEDPTNGQKIYGVVESGQLRFKRENGTIITSWTI